MALNGLDAALIYRIRMQSVSDSLNGLQALARLDRPQTLFTEAHYYSSLSLFDQYDFIFTGIPLLYHPFLVVNVGRCAAPMIGDSGLCACIDFLPLSR